MAGAGYKPRFGPPSESGKAGGEAGGGARHNAVVLGPFEQQYVGNDAVCYGDERSCGECRRLAPALGRDQLEDRPANLSRGCIRLAAEMRLEPEDLLGEVASTALEYQGRRVRRGGCGEPCRDGAATEAVEHQLQWIDPVGYDVAESYAHRRLGRRAGIVSRPGRTPIAGLRYRGGEKAALVPPLKDTAFRRRPSTRSLAELMAMDDDDARPWWCPVWTGQEGLDGLALMTADHVLLNAQLRHGPLRVIAASSRQPLAGER